MVAILPREDTRADGLIWPVAPRVQRAGESWEAQGKQPGWHGRQRAGRRHGLGGVRRGSRQRGDTGGNAAAVAREELPGRVWRENRGEGRDTRGPGGRRGGGPGEQSLRGQVLLSKVTALRGPGSWPNGPAAEGPSNQQSCPPLPHRADGQRVLGSARQGQQTAGRGRTATL